MKFLALFAAPAAVPSKKVWYVSVATAILLVVMVVAQLFTYEDFPGVIQGLWQTGDMASSQILAASIVVTEVFALPFLLFMKLSPLMRMVSMACGWFAAFVWLLLSLWQLARPGEVNVGVFGATLPLHNTVVAVLVAMIFATDIGYVAYATRGQWLKRKRHS